MIDTRPLWDFDDPARSETRLREAAARSAGAERDAWLTQVARALALQRRLKAELDAVGEVDPYVDEELALLEG